MSPKIKNILIFIGIAIVIGVAVFFFMKKNTEEADLVSSASTTETTAKSTVGNLDSSTTSGFLTLLLSVRSIKLDDSIFRDTVFNSLRDSSVYIYPDDNNGRVNPFAPIGVEPVVIEEPVQTEPVIEGEQIVPTDGAEATVDGTVPPSTESTKEGSLQSSTSSENPSKLPASTPTTTPTTTPTATGTDTQTGFDFDLDGLLDGLE